MKGITLLLGFTFLANILDYKEEAKEIIHNYKVFTKQPLAFGKGLKQAAETTVNLPTDLSNIKSIKMFLQIDCPKTEGCDDWDRFANIKVKDTKTNKWFELGRYITPYWTGTKQLDRGFEFDVTDFKSLLTGKASIRIYIENWTAKIDLISVDFDYIEGKPDYPYYAVSEVLGYHKNSLEGVPYGVTHNFDLGKTIQIPDNVESAHLRTIISGWGHATPVDPGTSRRCAEWCFRTHNIKLNGKNSFKHTLGPLGCSSNPISNQSPGNWKSDRAGWCPGMEIPIRVDNLDKNILSKNSFSFEYNYQDWTNNNGNGKAIYATSTYIVVKSNTKVTAPIVTD